MILTGPGALTPTGLAKVGVNFSLYPQDCAPLGMSLAFISVPIRRTRAPLGMASTPVENGALFAEIGRGLTFTPFGVYNI